MPARYLFAVVVAVALTACFTRRDFIEREDQTRCGPAVGGNAW